MNEIAGVALAFVVSLVVVLVITPICIPLLQRLKVGQEVRDDGPRTHLKKQGTATMGGVVIILGAGIAGFIFTSDVYETSLLFIIMLGCGLLGLWDDFLKVVLRRPLGLRARAKVIGQLLVGIILAWGSSMLGRGTLIAVPYTGIELEAGFLYYIFVVLVLVATANAVNLTDGLDGLASGLMVIISAAFVLIALLTGHYAVAVFAGALGGACLGFLRYN
ncbi:MAG TPA: phospho-N-acetylmuramoyl-pentapeptide-transferase, partial [Peptococcaceae bacterium]|nr:phospho-N-acetylmuramoyl-pentapeptide-transferase [Peptococcaceae bacterium]